MSSSNPAEQATVQALTADIRAVLAALGRLQQGLSARAALTEPPADDGVDKMIGQLATAWDAVLPLQDAIAGLPPLDTDRQRVTMATTAGGAVSLDDAGAYAEAIPDATEDALTGRVIIYTRHGQLTVKLGTARAIFGRIGRAIAQVEQAIEQLETGS